MASPDLPSGHPLAGTAPLTGLTTDGLRWRWLDRPARASRLVLMGSLGPSRQEETWEVEHSRRVLDLFRLLQLPGVAVEWQRPRASNSEQVVAEDCLPRWELPGGEQHAFLYGISQKLWGSLEFSSNPPNDLVEEWVTWHVDCDG